ncbi:MAG: hypothetical protein ABIT96_04845 [Ferruginibacter sp.]
MIKLFVLIPTLLISWMTNAQDLQTNLSNKKEMEKLGFITGEWKGKGWIMEKDGQKHFFIQTENISFKLDSTAMLIEGMGMDNGKIIHNALAIITYNKTDSNYSFHSYLSNGMEGNFKAEVIGEKLYWYPIEGMRYIIYLNEKRQWYETGEMKRGEQWFQFFEMTLDKK